MRLFVAAWPPEEVLDVVASLSRPERTGVRWTTPDQWHVTLRFLGSVDDPGVAEEALRGAVSGRSPVDVVVGPETVAFGRHLLVAPVGGEGLDDIAAAVADATADIGAPADDRPFRGHVTVARCKQGDARRLAGERLSARWRVDCLCLVRSETHPAGARYETVSTAPLTGG